MFQRGDDDDAPLPEQVVDQAARKAQLIELEEALTALITAMSAPPAPVQNPGWQGRIRDYAWVRGEVMVLTSGTITHDGLYDLMLGVRPVFRGAVPDEYAFIAPLQERMLSAVRVMQTPLPTERH